jgi:hypothetical protein
MTTVLSKNYRVFSAMDRIKSERRRLKMKDWVINKQFKEAV